MASGSNIGLLNSFPVGQVEQHNLRPLTFQEFIHASDEPALIKAFDSQINTPAVHTILMDKLTDYFFTGGMPEAVCKWYQLKQANILERIAEVSKVHSDLVNGYRRDFGKYAGKVDAMLIESVFNSIPSQLAIVGDESVQRFKFKGVHERKSRYKDLETAIYWLKCCNLVLSNYPVEGLLRMPFAAYKKENMVKLFHFDVGLLNHMLGSGYREIKQQNYEYKGYIAENFVQQELTALGYEPCYSWHDARAEIEFILSTDSGEIIPVEVKSGKRTRAKSLASYIEKNRPKRTFKLTGTQGSSILEKNHTVMPLYYAHFLKMRITENE
ncbi:ATP-binding protein [Thorsellia anophelis]|uniref:DUF4143 domain-containing protein n=1 Tax=Thorsellia anophelis DSM 18579 TaxID=1123402 RepID=A0A1H9Y322_9GAMM|nr:DUF4143 domain-containing protein [Thorsellia anophelis]SES63142.1 hypothetical protein SAMN02583745_00021 [Thorsellia anophelis DSM 18579]